jgi:hypothetical protein
MTAPHDPSPLDDDDLLIHLQHALDELDPVPDDAIAVARSAASLGRVDEALAELLFDSLLDEPGLAVRSDVLEARSLAFQGGGHRLDLELLDDGDVVLGQLDPAGPAEVDLESAEGTRVGAADDLGRFRFDGARGPVRFRVRLQSREILTPWITW